MRSIFQLLHRTTLIAVIATGLGRFTAIAQPNPNADVGLITFQGTPFTDVIQMLVRRAKLNCILDPRVAGKEVNVRLEKMTVTQALDQILKAQGYEIIQNPVTSVARIVATNLNVKPVTLDQIHGNTNYVLEVVKMDSVPLGGAIKMFIPHTGLNVEVDSQLDELSRDAAGRYVPPVIVSFHWENISAPQAIAALVDNYNLAFTEDSTTGKFRITKAKNPVPKPTTSETPRPAK